MTKIVFAIPDMGSGGAERVISILSRNFASQGIQSEILMMFGNRIHYDLHPSIKLHKLGLMTLPFWQRIKLLRNFIIKLRPKKGTLKIYAFLPSTLRYVIAATIGLRRVKVISSERNNPYINGKSILSRIKNTIPYLLSSHTVFQTSDAQKYYFLPKSHSSIIPNPITPVENKWKGNLSPSKLVSICRLHSQKNIPMSLEVINILKSKYPDIHLDIYGEGPIKEEISHLIDSMNLTKYVSLKGTTTNVIEVLTQSSIFISTSDFEGISNSMLEAMSIGMPLLCTDCPIGGARLMLQDCGTLSPVNDPMAFAEKLDLLLFDQETAKLSGKRAHLKSLQYSPELISQKWLNVIK